MVLTVAVGFGANQAQATSDTIPPPIGGEYFHEMTFEQYDRDDFAQADDNSGNGIITASRINDDDDDEVWSLGGSGGAQAHAVLADLNQTFGHIGADGTLGDFTKLFDVALGMAGDFKSARQGSNGTGSFRHVDNDNAFAYLVSYKITGRHAGGPIHKLFAEDPYQADEGYDKDINEPAMVPTPGAFGAGLALLGVVGFTRRRRQRTA